MSENDEPATETVAETVTGPCDVQTVAITADAGELPTVRDVSADVADVVSTMRVETPTEPATTQASADEEAPGTLLPTMPALPVDTSQGSVPQSSVPQGSVPPGYRRIGPGIPAARKEPGTPGIDPATAAAWHGIPPRKPRRALLRGWLLPLAVLVGVIALLLWQHIGGRLSVSGVTASAGTPSIGCDSTETITATLRTNGDAGTIVYRWVRSDGTVSDALRQSVGDGTKQVEVVLRWAFSGHGSMHALATIDVESPGTASAVTSFAYNCP